MLDIVVQIAVGVIIVWLAVLSYMFFVYHRRLATLLRHTRKNNLDEILDVLMKDSRTMQDDIHAIKKEVVAMAEENTSHIRHVITKRFNPFGKSGSEQSFLLMLLDDVKNGVSLNFIYTHEGVRVYAKHIKHGKGVGLELSHEEQKALDEGIH